MLSSVRGSTLRTVPYSTRMVALLTQSAAKEKNGQLPILLADNYYPE